MRHKISQNIITVSTLVCVLLASMGGASAAPLEQSGQFADPAFGRVWGRTDSLVDLGKVRRSFYWGPQPNTGALQEDYAEGPGGKRMVQYFDKSRMEINDPKADKTNPFYVTNGLLTVELMEGRVQIANNGFRKSYPASLPLASDHNDRDAPTYASFLKAVRNEDDQTGKPVERAIGKDGPLPAGNNDHYKSYGVKSAYYVGETFHNIPDVFWTFLNASGPVMEGGKEVTGKLNNPWFYAAGYPLTDAYWASVKIEDKPNTDVLIQPFERRVLTYVPSAPEGFRVQMGNIGQHYYDWRYNDTGKPLASEVECVPNRGGWVGNAGELWSAEADVRAQAGCFSYNYAGYGRVVLMHQRFQGGAMLYEIGYDSSSSYPYVLYNDGTVEQFYALREDFAGVLPRPTIEPGVTPYPTSTPLPSTATPTGILATPVSLTPAEGLYAPMTAFARIWRDNVEVRHKLGWGIDRGRTIQLDPNTVQQKEAIQTGTTGVIYDLGAGANEMLVLYDPKTSYLYKSNWAAYARP